MWDTGWTISCTDAVEATCTSYPISQVGDYGVDDLVPESRPLKPTDDEQAQKLKVARFAHVPVDCLEIKIETKEA